MPVTYQVADDEVKGLVADVMEATFPELAEADLAVDVLMAFAAVDKDGNQTGVAVKLHGVPCLATIRVVNLKDRVAGLGDVRIILDGDRWPESSDARRRALIDHELNHVELQRDDAGAVKTDDAERPVVKLKPHDFELGGFWATVVRHGKDAPEATIHADIAGGFRERLEGREGGAA